MEKLHCHDSRSDCVPLPQQISDKILIIWANMAAMVMLNCYYFLLL